MSTHLTRTSVDGHARAVVARDRRIDVSFNAVGIPQAGIQGIPLDGVVLEAFSLPVATYTRSHFVTARVAARRMVEQRSGVILMHTPEPARMGVALVGGMGSAWAALDAAGRCPRSWGLTACAPYACGPPASRDRHHRRCVRPPRQGARHHPRAVPDRRRGNERTGGDRPRCASSRTSPRSWRPTAPPRSPERSPTSPGVSLPTERSAHSQSTVAPAVSFPARARAYRCRCAELQRRLPGPAVVNPAQGQMRLWSEVAPVDCDATR